MEMGMIRIGLENNMEGRSMTWALDRPGCYAYGANGDAALAAVPAALEEYAEWHAAHGENWPLPAEIVLDETFDCYTIDDAYELATEGYEVNAWFHHDWKPLTAEETSRAVKLLTWAGADLLKVVDGLSPEDFTRPRPGERWSIEGIFKHVGGAEWWYLDRLGLAFPRAEVPADPFARFEKVHAHLFAALPGLSGSTQVVGVDGEFWSPRKLVRRAAYHLRDHVVHIQKLRG
jgi:hypothetical protein